MEFLGLKNVPKPDTPKKTSNGLVVASCAAVLTVYAAGYVRTQDAADRLASQIAKRRATVSIPEQAHLSIPDSAMRRDAGRNEQGDHIRPIVESRDRFPPLPKPPAEATSPSEVISNVTTEIPVAPVVTEVAAPVPIPAPAAAPAPVTASIAPAPITASIAPAPVTSFIAPPPAPAAIAAPAHVWKDGSYSGWGYSRHGNIEATVVIEGGRIASAVISQCRTRYSCSVIDRLPPQVAKRQSADVDYVSGATQSADAFYGAVVEALNKAK